MKTRGEKNGTSPPRKRKGAPPPGSAPETIDEVKQRKRRLAQDFAQVMRGITRPIFLSARRPLKPGRFRNNPAGWKIELEGPNTGTAIGPNGERMEFIDFLSWAYGIPKEQALLEIQSVVASKD